MKIFFVLFILASANFANGQCGLDPISGLTTISTTSQIINSYYPGQGNPTVGAVSITAGALDVRGNSTPIAAGDLILVIQMQGADINATNTDAYGNGVSGGDASGYLNSNLYAGNYEYNSVASVAGSTINLSYSLANNYYTRAFASGALRTYQVIRIPRYYDFTITGIGSVVSPSWNGNSGGVVVIDAANIVTINGSISVSGMGFRGGGGIDLKGATAGNTNGSTAITNTDYRWNSPITTSANLTGAAKGEGIAGTPAYVLATGNTTITTNTVEGYTNGSMGRGAPAVAGGGGTDGDPANNPAGNQYNTGGGGGGNAGTGGKGGSGWHGGAGNVNTYPTGGFGGAPFAERNINRFIMGGGGGAGTANNSTAANQYMSSGGAGGGIILLRAKSYAGNGSVNANGAAAVGVTGAGTNTDAAGGGGAGGTIVAVTRQNIPAGLNLISANVSGGRGGNMETYFDHGPGGGGGGGFIVTNGTFASTAVVGGANGLTRAGNTTNPITNTYGATSGTNGQVLTLAAAPVLINANNVASPCGLLPIRLSFFNASINESTVLLKWGADNAINFSHFVVQYSTDGSLFAQIGIVNFNVLQGQYQFNHFPVTASINYYRLKLVNTDGSFTYSNILVVRKNVPQNRITVYPQPANEYATISISVLSTQSTTFRLFNSNGQQVQLINTKLTKGDNYFQMNNLNGLPDGTYYLSAIVDNKLISKKLVIGMQ